VPQENRMKVKESSYLTEREREKEREREFIGANIKQFHTN